MSDGWRTVEFASAELLLDIFFIITKNPDLDLESFWILICVAQNSARTVVNDPSLSAVYINDLTIPDHLSSSMSRRAIADKTGLSRETVRRRTNKMVKQGWLKTDEQGDVRVSTAIYNDNATHGLNALHAAVLAYMKRLEENKVQMPLEKPGIPAPAPRLEANAKPNGAETGVQKRKAKNAG